MLRDYAPCLMATALKMEMMMRRWWCRPVPIHPRRRGPSQTKGKEEKEKEKKKKRPRTTRTQRTAQPVDDEEGDQDTGGQPAIDAIDAGTMTVDASAIPPALQWEVGASGIASTQLRSFDEEVASSTGTDQVCSLPVSCLCLRLLLCV